MQFQQSQVTRSTQFALRQDGLFVSQRDGRGQVDIAVEISYEEVLPIHLEYRNALPTQRLGLLITVGGWLIIQALNHYRPGHTVLPENFWVYVVSALAGLGLVVLYAWQNWWHQAIVKTANLRVALADHPRDRRKLRAFIQEVETHAKGYLRREYAPINPLGLIEPQLRRLAWLHELAVLDTPEAQALATRLTGRLPGRGFKSMGQKLEAPYVN
ncbi:hypothetical protein GCM10023172_10330 [Hymenobacter ginsengisoli]|uniref:Uncharacterized protein n=1 Tax=Hymenobacter ginsengisoli TaxID=1051626 RepID=A0ABP8Q466_9BACT|nr:MULTISPECIES: hypothetical protein [unclassified Hymenobacter]MBO2032392.1 hypothetical protein [Hymenobacter sp. BT559]